MEEYDAIAKGDGCVKNKTLRYVTVVLMFNLLLRPIRTTLDSYDFCDVQAPTVSVVVFCFASLHTSFKETCHFRTVYIH